MVIDAISHDATYQDLLARLRDAQGTPISATGLWGSSAPMLAGMAARALGRSVLLVTAHLDDADQGRDDLELFWGEAAELFSAFETLPGEGAASDEIGAERGRLCGILRDRAARSGKGVPLAIVAPVQALMQPVPKVETLEANSIVLSKGDMRDSQALAAWFVDRGYERLDMVESPGDFALRGGILDAFIPGEERPIRIEFFGDEVESIRTFEVSTQRSQKTLDVVRLAAMPYTQKLAPNEVTSFFSYLPKDTLVVFDEPLEIAELGKTFWGRLPDPIGMMTVERVFRTAGDFQQLHLSRVGGTEGTPTVRFDVRSVQRFETKSVDAIHELAGLAKASEVVVYCETVAQQDRLTEMLIEHVGATPASIRFMRGMLHRGFHWEPAKLVLLGHHEIFHRYEQKRRLRRTHASRPLESWLDLKEGDYVVHVAHGIAKFEGMQSMRKGDSNKREEYLTLLFGGRMKIHVPVSQIDLLQKYIGSGAAAPALSTVGGTRWKYTKEKVEEAVDDLAADLLRIQAEREMVEGTAYPADTAWQREFEGSFIYTETEDQLRVAEEVKADLCRTRPMDRLLCGDVGFGKTELAMRAAFKVAEFGKQAAVLVPTTVLAEQHYKTFSERMADYPFSIERLSRFSTKKDQTRVIERAKKGQVDILIGTHRLLSEDVGFANLGLVVVDEEQRFGVAQKERLKQFRHTVDVLTLTATPIPRTLHLSMLGIRDISSLATPPMDRRSIVTQVRLLDEELVRTTILRELNREGQTFFVHNFVYNIQSIADMIRNIVPEARVVVGHGQMGREELEGVMLKFVRHEADVLVCTTIIESGIDIPNANTMFINHAERFGLSDLHQLRGRVGRYKHRAYCYLLLSPDKPVTSKAAMRLKAIEEFGELGAGFQIALRDLEIRGAGNILGAEQSGHIAAVGYEMYCQLLESSVKRLKNEKPEPFKQVHLDLDTAAQIPCVYIRSDRQRMEIYRRLVRCKTAIELGELESDLRDAFGPYPEPVQVLLDLAEIQVLAQPWGIRSIILRKPDVVFAVESIAKVEKLFSSAPGRVSVVDAQTVYLRLKESYIEPKTLLAVLRNLMRSSEREAVA